MLMSTDKLLAEADFTQILVLKQFRKHFKGGKVDVDVHPHIAQTLSQNLCKNSSELRLLSLQVHEMLFKPCEYLKKPKQEESKDQETIDTYYTGECDLVTLLVQYEKLPLKLDTEKTKNSVVRKVQVMISSGFVPEFYLDLAYNFLVGCLWLRFLPLHEPAQHALSEVFRVNPEVYLARHIQLTEQVGYLTQTV